MPRGQFPTRLQDNLNKVADDLLQAKEAIDKVKKKLEGGELDEKDVAAVYFELEGLVKDIVEESKAPLKDQ